MLPLHGAPSTSAIERARDAHAQTHKTAVYVTCTVWELEEVSEQRSAPGVLEAVSVPLTRRRSSMVVYEIAPDLLIT